MDSRLATAQFVLSTITVLLFTFASFVRNYGQKKYETKQLLPKSIFRIAGAGIISITYAFEAALIFLQTDVTEGLQDHIIAGVIQALAWASTCHRKDFLRSELTGLSLITLAFGLSTLALSVAKGPVLEHYAALIAVEGARIPFIIAFLADSLLRSSSQLDSVKSEEEVGLLSDEANGSSSGHDVSYGARPTTSASESNTETGSGSDDWSSDDDEDEDGFKASDSRTHMLRESGDWVAYLENFKIFLPHLIPRKDFKVQMCLVICLAVLMVDRALNVLIPRQIGIVADKIIAREQAYWDLAIYLFLYLLKEDSGLGLIKGLAKIPVEQFSYRQLTNAAFNHVMSLGLDFHSDRDSAEVMKAIEQGRALTNLLDTAVLEMLPTVIDMCVAFIFLYLKFNSVVAQCMVIASIAFIVAEVIGSSSNVENRRRSTKAEREQSRIMHQGVQSWLTVSAFNMFSYEKSRFGSAVDKHLKASSDQSRRSAYIDAFTEGMVPVTFFLLTCLIMHEIYAGRATPGDFAFFLQYWDFLIWPIKWLSHEYRYLQTDLIDAERLLDLLTTEPTVTDKEGAYQLGKIEGRVEFKYVDFAYDDRRKVLHDVNIQAAPGETIAFVGETGSGKSSLMKLLMRYYDITSGSIEIDGHDVRDVTQGSLRDVLGIVPQDPLLFNASIMENLRYARPSASDEEVFEACRASAVHDKILTFADGYKTKVGEQGVKLSGGEVQRLAIARAFLKDPRILILDEATSAVDTETESRIQSALKRLSNKRTTFVIAHRLSTIVQASQILVMHDGTVVERGTHKELLEKGERYYRLWQTQFKGQQEEEEAKKEEENDDLKHAIES